MSDPVTGSRALLLRDLEATGVVDPETVSMLEDAVTERRWWAEQWPPGAAYVVGLVAQDVQDALLERVGRWPLCRHCSDDDTHALYIYPEIGGPDPVWVCERSGTVIAAVGALGVSR